MAKDDGKAKDAKPNGESKDEIAARRRQREEEEKGKTSDPLGDGNGKDVEQRAAEAEGKAEEEDDGQFAFVVEEHGRRMTLNQLIARGTSVEYRLDLRGKSIPLTGGGGLLPPNEDVYLLVRGRPGEVKVSYTRDGDENITKATVFTSVPPKVVLNANTEAAQVMLRGEPPENEALAKS